MLKFEKETRAQSMLV